MEDGKVQWHPAFNSALKISLQDEEQNLYFEEEHLLGSKPMQVDLLVVKKEKDIHIKKSIGHIFRKHNLFEYKSPDDIFSVNDVYKVCGYACLYKSDEDSEEKIDASDVTISIVCNHYPKKMIDHIRQRGMKVISVDDGIYYLKGGIFPMQLIITKELNKDEYFWMQSLRSDLCKNGELKEVLDVFENHRFSKRHQSVMNVIIHANRDKNKESEIMLPILKEIFADEYAALVARDGDLEENCEKKMRQCDELDAQAEKQKKHINELDAQAEKQKKHINELDAQAEKQKKHINELDARAEKQKKHINELDAQAEKQKKYINELLVEIDDLELSIIKKMLFLEKGIPEIALRCKLSEQQVREIIEMNNLI